MKIFRVSIYASIFYIYILFISNYSILGSAWLDWHEQRILNAVQYLELNGFFSSYGYTIWTDCIDCSLDSKLWSEKIYLSAHGFSLLPYLIINYFFGLEALLVYGPFLDKIAIFTTAVVLSELLILFFRPTKITEHILGVIIFTFFIVNPWTYKMIISGWTEIYFVLFFMLSAYAGISNLRIISLLLLFIAGLFNYVWCFALMFFYLLIYFLPKLINDKLDFENYFFSVSRKFKGLEQIFSLFLAFILMMIVRLIAQINLEKTSGSSMLERIGISGIDIHNGGIIGALQFLGGNRITKCVYSYDESIITSNLNFGIEAYNCILSISSQALLSIGSIIGVFFVAKKFPISKKIIAPISFSILFLTLLLQQAFSAHLIGFSYVFSIIFATGLSYYFYIFYVKTTSISIRYIFSIPVYIGIIILSLRVSMIF